MNIKILIRLNAGENIGLGHLSRMLYLAKILRKKKYQIEFLINKNDKVKKIISLSKFPVTMLPIKTNSQEMQKSSPRYQKEEVRLISKLFLNNKPEVVIFDLLNTSNEFIECWKQKTNKTISFDNIGPGRKKIDLVFNALWFKNEDFALNNILVGYKYLLLKESLYKNRYQLNQQVKNIFIAFGGIDTNNLTIKILKFLRKFYGKFNFYVVASPLNSNYIKIVQYCKKNHLNYVFDFNNLYKITQKCDLAIVNGGLTLYEVLCQGIPTMMLRQTKNEFRYSTFPKELVIDLGMGQTIRKNQIVKQLEKIIINLSLRRNLHKKLLKEFSLNNYNNLIKNIEVVLNE